MTRGSVNLPAIKALLAWPLLLAAFTSGAAAFDYARPMMNPNYHYQEIPSHLTPACQVMVKSQPFQQYGITSDDLLYCHLPYNWSRFPSDSCACALNVGGVKVLRAGMVVWRPSTWWYARPW